MRSVVGFVIIGLLFIGQIQSTPLDDYVHAPDPTFGWVVIRTYEQPDYNLYILNFTSQKWFDGKSFLFFSSIKYQSLFLC